MAETEKSNSNPEDFKIDASPTKELFVSMLTRDLSLTDVISDLVDNCVDGAKKLRPKKNYEGLEVKIIATKDLFSIEDNCGGIDVDIARNYAFKFGRPAGAAFTPYSVGQFGIGMKRALFKLGRHIFVKSATAMDSFEIKLEVDAWVKEPSWDLQFHTLEEDILNSADEIGTLLEVKHLNDDVSKRFDDSIFITDLIRRLSKEHMYNIHNELNITVNGIPLEKLFLKLIVTDTIRPAEHKEVYLDGKVKVTIYAGIANGELQEGGWYIFCNDRLILGPEQTAITGWSGRDKANEAPKYHNQYKEFRGYVFFEAEQSSYLPWTTTKNDIDIDSSIFKAVRHQMLSIMRPVIYFINLRHEARKNLEGEEKKLPIDIVLDSTVPKSLESIPLSDFRPTFTHPAVPIPDKPDNEKTTKILYYVPTKLLDEVKKATGKTTANEVGKETFYYYYNNEI